MSFLDDVQRRVKNSVSNSVSYKASSLVNSAINAGVDGAVNKVKHSGEWKCSCGTTNAGKFCTNCGKPKGSGICKCPKCGWSTTGTRPKFCPDCGTPLAEDEGSSDEVSHTEGTKLNTTAKVASSGDGVTLANMTEHMQEVPEDLEQRAKDLEKTFANVSDPSQLKDAMSQIKDVATDSQNLMMGNMSVLVQALGNAIPKS